MSIICQTASTKHFYRFYRLLKGHLKNVHLNKEVTDLMITVRCHQRPQSQTNKIWTCLTHADANYAIAEG